MIKGILIVTLIEYAKSFIGTPYIWGANGGGAFDCSGYVQEVLSFYGLDPKGDQTAQTLYNHFVKESNGSGIQKNSLLFFGRSVSNISHVGIAINANQFIEAGGGGSNCKTFEDARKYKAHVRIRPILNRRDLVAALKIKPLLEN